ncbi:MAG: HypC/HybG/HupF family hydrogenase formation chaperone [Kiritimatiellales bacterium]|nr:HypC/HybG/HupF family hydrogenase formation chaperone [Kiritimatiellales bacterium]
MNMCLAVPVKVVELLDGQMAVGEQLGVQVEFSTALLDDVKLGDYVLVHTGIAIETLDEDEAQETLNIWNELNAGGE